MLHYTIRLSIQFQFYNSIKLTGNAKDENDDQVYEKGLSWDVMVAMAENEARPPPPQSPPKSESPYPSPHLTYDDVETHYSSDEDFYEKDEFLNFPQQAEQSDQETFDDVEEFEHDDTDLDLTERMPIIPQFGCPPPYPQDMLSVAPTPGKFRAPYYYPPYESYHGSVRNYYPPYQDSIRYSRPYVQPIVTKKTKDESVQNRTPHYYRTVHSVKASDRALKESESFRRMYSEYRMPYYTRQYYTGPHYAGQQLTVQQYTGQTSALVGSEQTAVNIGVESTTEMEQSNEHSEEHMFGYEQESNTLLGEEMSMEPQLTQQQYVELQPAEQSYMLQQSSSEIYAANQFVGQQYIPIQDMGQLYYGQQYAVNQYSGTHFTDQQYVAQQYIEQPHSGQPFITQPYTGQLYVAQPYTDGQYDGQQFTGQQYIVPNFSGQIFSEVGYTAQPYEGYQCTEPQYPVQEYTKHQNAEWTNSNCSSQSKATQYGEDDIINSEQQNNNENLHTGEYYPQDIIKHQESINLQQSNALAAALRIQPLDTLESVPTEQTTGEINNLHNCIDSSQDPTCSFNQLKHQHSELLQEQIAQKQYELPQHQQISPALQFSEQPQLQSALSTYTYHSRSSTLSFHESTLPTMQSQQFTQPGSQIYTEHEHHWHELTQNELENTTSQSLNKTVENTEFAENTNSNQTFTNISNEEVCQQNNETIQEKNSSPDLSNGTKQKKSIDDPIKQNEATLDSQKEIVQFLKKNDDNSEDSSNIESVQEPPQSSINETKLSHRIVSSRSNSSHKILPKGEIDYLKKYDTSADEEKGFCKISFGIEDIIDAIDKSYFDEKTHANVPVNDAQSISCDSHSQSDDVKNGSLSQKLSIQNLQEDVSDTVNNDSLVQNTIHYAGAQEPSFADSTCPPIYASGEEPYGSNINSNETENIYDESSAEQIVFNSQSLDHNEGNPMQNYMHEHYDQRNQYYYSAFPHVNSDPRFYETTPHRLFPMQFKYDPSYFDYRGSVDEYYDYLDNRKLAEEELLRERARQRNRDRERERERQRERERERELELVGDQVCDQECDPGEHDNNPPHQKQLDVNAAPFVPSSISYTNNIPLNFEDILWPPIFLRGESHRRSSGKNGALRRRRTTSNSGKRRQSSDSEGSPYRQRGRSRNRDLLPRVLQHTKSRSLCTSPNAGTRIRDAECGSGDASSSSPISPHSPPSISPATGRYESPSPPLCYYQQPLVFPDYPDVPIPVVLADEPFRDTGDTRTCIGYNTVYPPPPRETLELIFEMGLGRNQRKIKGEAASEMKPRVRGNRSNASYPRAAEFRRYPYAQVIALPWLNRAMPTCVRPDMAYDFTTRFGFTDRELDLMRAQGVGPRFCHTRGKNSSIYKFPKDF